MEERLSDNYFESLGAPKNITPLNALDKYRFKLYYNCLSEGSILDIGVLFGGFLNYVRKIEPDRVLIGTEINDERVKFSNRILGEKIVRVDFKNGLLESFNKCSVDNIVCSEVFEHINDNEIALKELCRVAKKRIILSVPYNEKIFYHFCIHCWKYTPSYSHLHSYQLDTFDNIIPQGWHISERNTFGNKISKFFVQKIDVPIWINIIEYLSSKIFPHMNTWMYIVLKKDE